jgi:hypothetical protein
MDIYFTYGAILEWFGKNVIITKIGMLAILTHFKETFRVNVSSLTTQYVQDDSFLMYQDTNTQCLSLHVPMSTTFQNLVNFASNTLTLNV